MAGVRRNYGLRVYGYVVMPGHVHLLLSEPEQVTLAEALKSLKQGVSRGLIDGAEHFVRSIITTTISAAMKHLWRNCTTSIVIR